MTCLSNRVALFTFSLFAFPLGLMAASPPFGFISCSDAASIQHLRSQELQRLYSEDQFDYRQEMDRHPDRPLDLTKLERMAVRDLRRRKRVAEIFAEGCFQSATDYANAATIFQHGNAPDHFFQAYIWAQQAVKLGDPTSKKMLANSIDRYLTKMGHKQLFGTQADKKSTESCYCLQEVEPSFPDSKRQEILGKTLSDFVSWLRSLNDANKCPNVYCEKELLPTPPGSVVGFW